MTRELTPFQIAIDGPVAAGKGTVSKLVASKLGYLYVDTGATYRVATLLAVRNGIKCDDGSKIASLILPINLDMEPLKVAGIGGSLVRVLINNEDVTKAIRTQEIDKKVPLVAALPEVRAALVAKQQQVAGRKDVVMEGRDITYRVLPKAQLRIYLDASEDERIRRRVEQLIAQGVQVDVEEVGKLIKERDRIDKNRNTDPLKIVEGVWYLDTTGMSIDEVVDLIVEKATNIKTGR